MISKEGDAYAIDAVKLGYNKVLGTGKVKNKFKITTPSCSKGAEEKVKAAGGEIIITKKEVIAKKEVKKEVKEEKKEVKQVKKEPAGEDK